MSTTRLPTKKRALEYAAALVNRELEGLRKEAIHADNVTIGPDGKPFADSPNPQEAERIFLSAVEVASMETRLRMMAEAPDA